MGLPYNNPDDPADVKGTKLPVQQADDYQWIKGQGWTTIQAWEGATKDSIVGKGQDMTLAGFTHVRISQPEPGKWRVEGRVEGTGDGAEVEAAETWELDNLAESADIQTHPNFRGIDNDELRKVLEAIKNPVAGTAPALTDGDAIDLYDLLLRKVDTYAYSVMMIRVTAVPAPSDVSAWVNGTEKIWSLNQMNISTPSILNAAAAALAYNPFGTAQNGLWGWKLDTVRVTEDTNGRSRFQAEWILNLWPGEIYSIF